MTPSEHLRLLLKTKGQYGKESNEYADAVNVYVERLIDSRTGEMLGPRALCPGCTVGSGVLGLTLRFIAGCDLCDDSGLGCPGCGNALWVRTAPGWYDPTNLADNRVPVTLKACPVCATWVGSTEEGGYQQDRLRVLQHLSGYYVAQ